MDNIEVISNVMIAHKKYADVVRLLGQETGSLGPLAQWTAYKLKRPLHKLHKMI